MQAGRMEVEGQTACFLGHFKGQSVCLPEKFKGEKVQICVLYHSQQRMSFKGFIYFCYVVSDASTTTCKEFYDFICNKVASVGNNILIHWFLLRICMFSLHSMRLFIWLLSLVVNGITAPNCTLDIILAKVLILVGSSLLVFITYAVLRHAVVRPLLEHLDTLCCPTLDLSPFCLFFQR